MIKKIAGIPTHKQREYLRAGSKAYKALIEKGYAPFRVDDDFKYIVVKCGKRQDEENQYFYFNNWQEANEELSWNIEEHLNYTSYITMGWFRE